MHLLYMAFGPNTQIHLQTAFSIYSFLTQQQFVSSVNIVTDNEDFYKHLNPRVNIIRVTENDLTEWKGEYQFFWRIKIKAIEKACHLYPNQPVVYLDCDTFLFGDLAEMESSMKNGLAVMHDDEGELSQKKNKSQKKLWRQVQGKSFGGISIQPGNRMWNSGVVGLPNTKNGKDCELILAVCDDMCARGITRYFIEQFSLSLALQKTYGLADAKSAIVHYWSTKDLWDKQINHFFIQAYFARWDYEKIIAQMKLFDTSATPFYQQVKNTNLRLKVLLDKVFPHTNLQYLPGK
ncbi:MAG: hypothetical protein ABI707_18295 [Ferruginibacter sp.]